MNVDQRRRKAIVREAATAGQGNAYHMAPGHRLPRRTAKPFTSLASVPFSMAPEMLGS